MANYKLQLFEDGEVISTEIYGTKQEAEDSRRDWLNMGDGTAANISDTDEPVNFPGQEA